MDKNEKFNEKSLGLYQIWARDVSGDNEIKVLPCNIIDQEYKNTEWYKNTAGWAKPKIKTMLLNTDAFVKHKFCSKHVKAVILHELGHIFYPRRELKSASGEYLAHLYALNKASKLGLEAERKELFSLLLIFSKRRNTYYRHVYRMLRRIGISK